MDVYSLEIISFSMSDRPTLDIVMTPVQALINQKPKIKMKQGKKSIKSGYKKAIITLKKGQSIDLTTGI